MFQKKERKKQKGKRKRRKKPHFHSKIFYITVSKIERFLKIRLHNFRYFHEILFHKSK